MVVKEYKLKVDTSGAQKNVDGLNSSLNRTSIANNKASVSSAKTGVAVGAVGKSSAVAAGGIASMGGAVGGAAVGFTTLKTKIQTTIVSLKSMKVAIIATGIGALLIGILALKTAFTSSEEGQNKFNKILGIIGATVSVFTDKLASLGEFLISVFENPKQALIDFKDAFVKNITNRISSAIETIGFLGSAIKKVFSGDFSGAMDDAKSAGSSYVDTLTGVKDTIGKVTESVKELATEIIKEGKAAGVIADQRAKADKLDRQIIVDRAKANKERAELLNKAIDKEKFTLQERIGFLTEAGRLEDEITAKEIQAAKLRLDAKIAENALGLSTKEDLEEEATLKANLINLETAKLSKAKEVTSQIIALNAEAAAADKAIKDQKKLDDDEAQAAEDLKAAELKTLKDEIRNAEAVTEDERRALEIEKVGLHYDKLIAEAKRLGLSTVALEKAKVNALNKFNKENSDNEIKWDELTSKEKGKIAADGLNNLASILGEETAAGKAAAIASATISTFQSATDSYKSLAGIPIIGPALGFAAAGAAVASGFAQVKAITATKLPSLAGKSAPSVSGGSPSAPSMGAAPQPPAFSVVGASETNQLAGAIGSQTQQPVKAFVVSSDVSTSQELERNIISGASI